MTVVFTTGAELFNFFQTFAITERLSAIHYPPTSQHKSQQFRYFKNDYFSMHILLQVENRVFALVYLISTMTEKKLKFELFLGSRKFLNGSHYNLNGPEESGRFVVRIHRNC